MSIMTKHIMFLFLSVVRVDSVSKKISVTDYQGIGQVYTTNESAVRYVLQKQYMGQSITLDKLFVFASDTVRGKIYCPKTNNEPYVDENGQEWTHLAYFKQRLIDVIPTINDENTVIDVDYHENEPIAEVMTSAMEMADVIWDYIGENKDDTVILHTDMTGGMRHANMMMLAIMRLMQYGGVNIGYVLYSDFNKHVVEEANDIYRLFDMAAGTEEFVRFGSVSAILHYFGYDNVVSDKPMGISDELHRLLMAMKNFAEEIKICHYGAFRQSIAELKTALTEFSVVSTVQCNVNERLMRRLQFRIQNEYAPILANNADDINLLEWCFTHDYLQQVLTLYTERVPEIVFNSGMVEATESLRQRFVEECKGKSELRSENFWLFSVYIDPSEKSVIDAKLSELQKRYRNDIRQIMKKALFGDISAEYDWQTELHLSENHLQVLDAPTVEYTLHRFVEFAANPTLLAANAERDAWLDNLYNVHYEQYASVTRTQVPEGTTEEEIRQRWIIKFLKLFGKQKLVKLRELVDKLNGEIGKAFFSDVVWQEEYVRTQVVMHLVDNGQLICHIDREVLREIVTAYTRIKHERNRSNHAHERSKQGEIVALRDLMRIGIDNLKKGSEQAPKGRVR